MGKLLVALLFLVLNCTTFAQAIVELNYVTIAVEDLGEAAKLFSSKGFTLKKPHEFDDGFQKGLIAQSIRFENDQYLQLIAIDKSTKNHGALTNWYKNFLKNTQGGATLVVSHSMLKDLQKKLEKEGIKSGIEKNPKYDWLSFPPDSPLAPLSFIKVIEPPRTFLGVTKHDNGALAIDRVFIRPFGPVKELAKVFDLAEARGIGIDIMHTTFDQKANIPKIRILTKEKQDSFLIGNTIIELVKKANER